MTHVIIDVLQSSPSIEGGYNFFLFEILQIFHVLLDPFQSAYCVLPPDLPVQSRPYRF